VKRVCSVIPPSPRKCKAVLNKFAEIYSVELSPGPASRPPAANKTPTEVRRRATDFYLCNDISWMAPGRKDCVTVSKRTEAISDDDNQAYAIYQQEHPDDKVELSTFKTLRPDVVILKSDMPHNL
jgi:hypothetical protein